MNLLKCAECYFGNRNLVLVVCFLFLICTSSNEVYDPEFRRCFLMFVVNRPSSLLRATWSSCRCFCSLQWSLTRWPLKVSSISNDSTLLWFFLNKDQLKKNSRIQDLLWKEVGLFPWPKIMHSPGKKKRVGRRSSCPWLGSEPHFWQSEFLFRNSGYGTVGKIEAVQIVSYSKRNQGLLFWMTMKEGVKRGFQEKK